MKRFPHIYNKRPLFLSSVSLLFILYLIELTLSNQSSGFILVVSRVSFFFVFITFYSVENEIVSRNSVIQALNMRIKHEFKKYFMDSVFKILALRAKSPEKLVGILAKDIYDMKGRLHSQE